jgi:hypothetical protein
MPERVDRDHRRHDVAGDERVAHAVRGLDDTVADVADREDARLPAGLVDAVADFLDQLPEMERARVAHAVPLSTRTCGLPRSSSVQFIPRRSASP